jgi:glycosyltransferase involved in cell wall biosynthesis
MRVAILHPWFLLPGGGEKVMDVIAGMYPKADLFALFSDADRLPTNIAGRRLQTSVLNKIPGKSRLHFYMFPFFPWAIESFDIRNYDLVISSGGPVIMGANTAQGAVHVCYCHTPPRAWWDLYSAHQARVSAVARAAFVVAASRVRMWEFSAMQRIDHVIANSRYIARRTFQYFRRKCPVIYPPVETSAGYLSDRHDGYYLSVGRLGKEKRIDLLIEACNQMKRRFLIAGAGREEKRLKALAGPTIEFLGRVPDGEIAELYANCRAFLFAADEDFGIVPVEAQSFGRPVIAYGHGGSLETVRAGREPGCNTGIFFPEQSVNAVADAIRNFEEREAEFSPVEIQKHARQFDTSIFQQRFRAFVDQAMHVQNGRELP